MNRFFCTVLESARIFLLFFLSPVCFSQSREVRLLLSLRDGYWKLVEFLGQIIGTERLAKFELTENARGATDRYFIWTSYSFLEYIAVCCITLFARMEIRRDHLMHLPLRCTITRRAQTEWRRNSVMRSDALQPVVDNASQEKKTAILLASEK
ncbi:hypothetical protein F5051DRAFT_80409 [Lentinula edodes]|nr:hypothetical protein F5051DRAFT_80409 [Lentinula edodes]